jgi:hypothetical protein
MFIYLRTSAPSAGKRYFCIMVYADYILKFYQSLSIDVKLPEGVEFMNPYQDAVAFELSRQFYEKFYRDNNPRTLIFGINPGRFGGGITGVPFTDPVKLEKLGIANNLKKKVELSADFIYAMIDVYGGAEKFYHDFYITALSPLGFMKDGKNLNYYDIKILKQTVEPFMLKCIRQQLDFGVNRQRCYCLGEGENFKYLSSINKKHNFFEVVIPLAHPRFIMQYKRKSIDVYIQDYMRKFRS